MMNEKLNNALAVNEVAAGKNEQEVTVETKDALVEEMKGLTSLFVSTDVNAPVVSGNQLNKTARLTQIASTIANEIFAKVTTSGAEYEAQVEASMKSHDAMDDLIDACYDLSEVNIDFLKTVKEEELEKMIRSQQSKRSRAKSKAMTQENYLSMMTGAIAELLLRLAANKPKSSGGGTVMGEIGFSAEDIEHLAQFPEDLKKAIRNVQSKKSIMKSKIDFDPQSHRWLQLLRAEEQLKEVRDRVNGTVTQQAQEAIEVKKQAEEMLAEVDMESIPADKAVELLNKMKEMLASK